MKKIIIILLTVFYLNTNAQVVCFNSSVNYPTGISPNDLVAADFNNDGKKDLVIANNNSDSLSLFINNGTGGFGTAINFMAGSGQSAVLSADFNKDGNADIVFCNSNVSSTVIDTITILLGTGTGSFGVPTNYTVTGSFNGMTTANYGANPSNGMAIADFNGDSIMDLVVSNINTPYVSLLLGNGVGGFSSIASFNATGGSQLITDLTAGDFNGDGKVDIAVVNQTINGGAIMLGDGTGNLASPTAFIAGYDGYGIVNADFNEDTKLDLALSSSNVYSNSDAIVLGNGMGSVGSASYFSVGSRPKGICSGDFDKDGHMDLVNANYGSKNVSIIIGSGTGIFSTPYNFPVDSNPTAVVAEDFNGDGWLDVAVTNSSSNNITVILACVPTSTCIVSASFSIGQDTAATSTWIIIPHYSSQVTSAVWNWGDGTTTTGLFPSHIYSQPNFYTQCVTVYNNCGDSATTCTLDSVFRMSQANASMVYINVVDSTSMGINKLKNQDTEVKVYPNPTSSIIQVSVSNYQAEEIKIYDVLGNIVVSSLIEKQRETTIDMSNLKSGIYFVHVGNNVQKFVVQH
ncbi:MAG TPA: FG-GAP-like repeat-containing protein [Bacteroidia bacterium]|jgi:hypothetical protein|nr:FG-GAP-like repeat-containing protein [Bacteroidia bacterium]